MRSNVSTRSVQVISITALHVVYSDEQGVIHNVHPSQEFGIAFELFRQKGTFLRSKFHHFATIQILKHSPLVFSCLCFGILPSHNAPTGLANITVRREKVVHYDEMYFGPMWELDVM